MEIPNQPPLPALCAEILGEQAYLPGLRRLIDSIGCLAAQSQDQLIINTPTLKECTGFNRDKTRSMLRELESAGLLEQYTPDPSSRPPGGRWNVARTICFTLTSLGRTAIPEKLQEDCKLRNTLIRQTPKEEALINCARCLMTKTDETGEIPAGAFTRGQVADCLGTNRQNVNYTFKLPYQQGLLKRERHQRQWGSGTFYAYSPTEKGMPIFSPLAASECPRPDTATRPHFAVKLSATQQAVVDALAERYLTLILREDPAALRQSDIKEQTGLPGGTVNSVFQKLANLDYLEKCVLPGRSRTDHYKPTEIGVRLLKQNIPTIRQRLVEAGLVPTPDEILATFEQNRPALMGEAKRLLRRSDVSTAWAEDILSEAALYIYQRFGERGDLIGKGDHLEAVIRVHVHSRTTDFIRRELGTKGKKNRRLFYYDNSINTGESEYSPELGSDQDEPSVEDQVLENMYSDQLYDWLAHLLLAMNEDQRDAIFHLFRKSEDESASLVSTPKGTLKSRRYYGRRAALEEMVASLTPAQELSDVDSTLSTREAINVVLNGARNLGGPAGANEHDPEEVIKMKAFIKNFLYPEGTE